MQRVPPAKMLNPSRKLGLQLVAALIVLNAAVALWAASTLAEQRLAAVQKAEATTQNLAAVLDQNIAGSVEKIDLALQSVVDELQRQLRETGRLDEPQVSRMLATYRQRMNGLIGIRVANAEGLVVLGPDVRPDQLQSWADRPFFALLRDQPALGLYITQPLTGRVTGVQLISFVRRINLPDGRFGGLVSAAVPLAHFNQLLAGLDLGRSGVAALRGADFGLIARQPPSPVAAAGTVGSQVIPPELARAKELGQTQGTYTTGQTSDGTPRTVSFRFLKDWPFTLVVGLAARDYLVAWETERAATLFQLASFALLTSLMGWMLWRAAHRQRVEAERSQALLRGASDGIHIVGPDGIVTDASDAFARMLGCRPDEVIGAPIQRWQVDAGSHDAQRLPEALPGTRHVETRLRHRYGHLVDVEIASHPLELDGKAVLFSSARDITERKRSDQAMQHLLEEKTALLKEVHHRVKNNLQVITSLLRLEAGRSKTADTKEVLGYMRGRIRTMAQLHESLYRSATFAVVDLGVYLGQVATQAFKTQELHPDAVRLTLNLGSVEADMDQATAAALLLNELVSNCLKHGFPEGQTGEVCVELQPAHDHDSPPGGRWCLRVSDTGVGLPPDFEDKREASLGLQLVSDLSHQLGGSLAIDSASAQGARFSVVFAVQAPAPLVMPP